MQGARNEPFRFSSAWVLGRNETRSGRGVDASSVNRNQWRIGDAAQNTLSQCAKKVDGSRRGPTVGLWWQLLSFAFQIEYNRVISQKAHASLHIADEGGEPMSVLDMYTLLPCLAE